MARAVAELTKAVDYSPLRRRTAAVDRSKAAPGDVRAEGWSDGLVSGREAELVVKIPAERDPPADPARIVIQKGAWESTRIYLERIKMEESAVAGDSGWFIGSGDDPTGAPTGVEVLSVSVAQLTEVRPDLREVLALPAGYLVVIDMGGVTAVLDEKGQEVWGAISGANASRKSG
jgi:hypothetical protein